MFDFYQRRKLKNLVASRLARLFLLVLIIMMGFSAFARYQIAKNMEVRRVEAEKELGKLREQKATLGEQVQYLSDDRGIEAEMRRQFDVALKNEQVVVIVEPEKDAEISATSSAYNESEEPAWYEFWR